MLAPSPAPRAGCRVTTGDLTIPSANFTCLAIETATELPSLALVRAGVVSVRECPGLRAPSREVFEWTRELLDESGADLQELDCIAFGAGPGSFTGVRVAVAVAQALGYACGAPLCPVSTLAALAVGAFQETTVDAVACCLDAHMGEVYFGVYRRDAERGVHPLAVDALHAPDAVTLPPDMKFLAAGPGWAAYPQIAERFQHQLVGIDAGLFPSAASVVTLARSRFLAGELVSPKDAQPNYLRQRVASESRATIAGRNES
jgi:tRNA threonylcarbamoyladenosine biosynthesis protein TsaB